MPRRVLLVITLLSGLTLAGFHAHVKKQPSARDVASAARRMQRPSSWENKLAPDFTVETRAGKSFRLADHIGRQIVILNFFASWCGPCRLEMPELGRFLGSRAGEPIVLLGIDAGESPEVVDAFVKELALAFPVAIDEGDLQKKYSVDSFPTTVVIGADGRVVLYEPTAILNTDVSFAGLLEPSLDTLRAGKGIRLEDYLDGLESEDYGSVREVDAEAERLEARAKAIAERMHCPCGCSHTVLACTCRVGRQIKERLQLARYSDKSDERIIEELNREFCMKEM